MLFLFIINILCIGVIKKKFINLGKMFIDEKFLFDDVYIII